MRVVVEPLETPEMGDTVETPDGTGRVVHPTTDPEAIVVELEEGGRASYDRRELGGFGR